MKKIIAALALTTLVISSTNARELRKGEAEDIATVAALIAYQRDCGYRLNPTTFSDFMQQKGVKDDYSRKALLAFVMTALGGDELTVEECRTIRLSGYSLNLMK